MSHFCVVVCLNEPVDVESALAAALAPYDENATVAPYRDYQDYLPGEHWFYRSLKKSAEQFTDGIDSRADKPTTAEVPPEWPSEVSKAQLARQKSEAELFNALPDPITWTDLAKAFNENYGDGNPLLVEAGGRAYQISTYNPKSKWDYWRIGGRWSGYFLARPGRGKGLLLPQREWDSPGVRPGSCDGGPKRMLDLKRMRDDAAEKAREEHDRSGPAVMAVPEAISWRTFADLTQQIDGYTLQDASSEYDSQPRVQAVRSADMDVPLGCSIERYQMPQEQFVQSARAGAVPGYAVLTTGGEWMSPGEMGWFGVSSDDASDRASYYNAANHYIDSLPDSAWLIAVDCHI